MSDNIVRLKLLLEEMKASDPAALQLAHIVDHMRAPLVYAKETGIIVWVNRAAREFFGYGFHELEGQPISILIPDRMQGAHEAAFRRRVSQDLATNVKVTDVTISSIARMKDGTEKLVIIRMSSHRTNGTVTYTASFEERPDVTVA